MNFTNLKRKFIKTKCLWRDNFRGYWSSKVFILVIFNQNLTKIAIAGKDCNLGRLQLKIVHFSDTHLGFNDLDVLNDDNVNQREADFYEAFSSVIEQIKEIRQYLRGDSWVIYFQKGLVNYEIN